MDMAISRTIQQAVLLVTMGNDEVGMPTKEQIGTLRKIFENESVGRILVSDYTTDIKFIIPEIGQILDPRKYEVVDRDIRYGLNNVLFGEEKYANTSTKIEVFLSRLKHARETFMNDFLLPEMKSIARNLGFKNLPVPRFKDADFKNDANLTRTYSRLIELGVLTPEEGIKAIETGRLPNPEESIEAQQRFKDLKDQGFYQPLIGGSQQQAGRPSGSTGIPQSTKNVSPIGQGKQSKANEDKFSLSKVKENLVLAQKLEEEVSSALRKKHNIKKLSYNQKEVAEQISKIIVANETPENWVSKIEDYIKQPVDQNQETVASINSIAYDHQVDSYLASILYHSKVK